MGDSSSMTIEFLRARLLSERSVSKAAKERSDQLSKRVIELEEQLNVVIIQRKKAEKAAIEAFSVLQSHGIDDFYETVGSSSDKDESPSENECNETLQEEETSKVSEKKEAEVGDALSSSGPGVSASQGGSLSWKSHSHDSEKKVNGRQIKQRLRRISLMSSINSSPKYNLGKSCRKIKRRETGSTTEDEGDNGLILDDHRKAEAAAAKSDSANDQINLSAEVSVNEPSYEDSQRKKYDPCTSVFGTRGDEEMERVLEQHADLIGRYEAEEKAQREWEEKYNEKNISILDPLGLEDCSSSPEHAAEPVDKLTAIVLYEGKETKSNSGVPSNQGEHTARLLSDDPETLDEVNPKESRRRLDEPIVDFYNDLITTDQTRTTRGSISEAHRGMLRSQVQNNRKGMEGGVSEVALSAEGSTTSSPMANHNQDLESESSSGSSFNIHSNAYRILNSPLAGGSLTTISKIDASKKEYSSNQDPTFKQQSQTASNNLQGVLEALQRAKLSLRQELHKLPSQSEGSLALTTVPSYDTRTVVPNKTLEVPFGSAGLFRLPTDAFPQAQNPRSHNYGTGSSLTSSYPRLGYVNNMNDIYSAYESNNSMPMKYSESYHPDIGLPAPHRFSEPYSDLSIERTFPNRSGTSFGKQHFPYDTTMEAIATGMSSSRVPMHSDVMREALPLSVGFVSSKYNQHTDRGHLGMEEPAFGTHYLPYSELARERRLHDEIPKHQIDWRSGMSATERYLYSGHGIQSDWRIR